MWALVPPDRRIFRPWSGSARVRVLRSGLDIMIYGAYTYVMPSQGVTAHGGIRRASGQAQ
ncbi:hypothetical protein BC827DRAFT_1238622 [Russula dissimulans]|nr:hypothetical protein BC827DRAFT_1238622 [Russula dissimulans]